jgi:hypothetical protein
MTLMPARTALVLCDVQERLFPAMDATLFQLLRQTDTDLFRELARLIR